MVAIYKLPCCGREMSYGRFIPQQDAMSRPETKCPLCGKTVVLHYHLGRLGEEKLNKVKHPHKYVIPLKEEIEEEADDSELFL